MKITDCMTDRERAAFRAGRAVESILGWRARRRLLKLSGLPNIGSVELCTMGAWNSLEYARSQLSLIPPDPQAREEALDNDPRVRAVTKEKAA